MGKLSKLQKSKKHKKIKTVNQPYGKRPKNKDGNVVDQKPSNTEDQELPNSVREVMRLRTQTKQGKFKRIRSKGKDIQQQQGAQESTPASGGRGKPLKPAPVFKQGKRESERQFMHRVDREVQAVIHKAQFEDKYDVDLDQQKDGKVEIKKKKKPKSEHQQMREKDKKDKKKAKKLKKEEKKSTGFEKYTDVVQFGEVAMAPPSLTAKPRKVPQGNNDRPGVRSLLLKDVLSGSTHQPAKAPKPVLQRPRAVGKTVKRKHLPMVQQRILDEERQRAIDLYRKMKGHTPIKLPPPIQMDPTS